MAEVKLENIRKSFGDVEVIHGIDLDISDGEFVVFVGPSGCGKSTLLRLIAGLEQAGTGRISINNHDMTQVLPSDRGIAMVFQSYALYPHMTVEQNMSFSLRISRIPKEKIAKQVLETARILQLEPLLNRFPRELSGGQRQRVAIGRAIVRQPGVFLFDEPLSNLDAELRVEMRLEIAKLHRQLKATIIYVTHDQVEAMTLADKIVIMREGKVEQVGAPLQLYDFPVNTFVAGFIGSPKMNFLNAQIISEGATHARARIEELNNLEVQLPATKNAFSIGDNIILGIRPEHFDDDGENKVEIQVDAFENLGGLSFVYAQSKANTSLTIEARNMLAIEPGATIHTGFNSNKLHIFNPDDGSAFVRV